MNPSQTLWNPVEIGNGSHAARCQLAVDRPGQRTVVTAEQCGGFETGLAVTVKRDGRLNESRNRRSRFEWAGSNLIEGTCHRKVSGCTTV